MASKRGPRALPKTQRRAILRDWSKGSLEESEEERQAPKMENDQAQCEYTKLAIETTMRCEKRREEKKKKKEEERGKGEVNMGRRFCTVKATEILSGISEAHVATKICSKYAQTAETTQPPRQ
jgi:hypothetical protein